MNDKGNIIIYQTKDGQTLIDVRLENETVWIHRTPTQAGRDTWHLLSSCRSQS